MQDLLIFNHQYFNKY